MFAIKQKFNFEDYRHCLVETQFKNKTKQLQK